MGNPRRTVLALPLLLLGPALLVPGLLPLAVAADQGLTEAQIDRTESETKDYVIDLMAAHIWTKDSDEYRQFRRYGARDTVRIATYDSENRRFTDNVTEITGAEYRRAFVTARAFASYARLDTEAQERINMEIYGQRTRPERGTDAYNRGRDKIATLASIISGEHHARPAQTQDQTGKKDK